jgi:hypothetical protein
LLIVEAVLAAEVAFRERRPIVGQLGLGADQDDVAVESFFTKGDGRGSSGQRSADDHDRRSFHLDTPRRFETVTPRLLERGDDLRNHRTRETEGAHELGRST